MDGVLSMIAALRRRSGERTRWPLLVEGRVSLAAGVLEIADAVRLRHVQDLLYQFMSLFPQPTRTQPAVQYMPVPYRGPQGQPSSNA